MPGRIYIVPTPIGNLGDLSDRVKQTFRQVDFIAAEDTRVTLKLLNHLGLKKPLVSYHEHNIKQRGEYVISRVLAGEDCALCSDAGTPCISDPGQVLVSQAHRAGIALVALPGPSAFVTALSASGQDTGRFCFEGFLSTVKKQRRQRLEALAEESRTMVFYEAPHKLLNTLSDFCKYFGRDRSMTVARELTKVHEEIKLTTVGRAFEYYGENTPKGEFVLIVAGKPRTLEEKDEEYSLRELASLCLEKAARDNITLSEAAKIVSAGTPFSKSRLYSAAAAAKRGEAGKI